MCYLDSSTSMPTYPRHTTVSQQGSDITINIYQQSTGRPQESHGHHHHCGDQQADATGKDDLIAMLEKFIKELEGKNGSNSGADGHSSDKCGSEVKKCCDDHMDSVFDSKGTGKGCNGKSDSQSSSDMLAALLAAIIKQLKGSSDDAGAHHDAGHCDHSDKPGQGNKPGSSDISKLFQASEAQPGSYNILNDGPGQQKRLRETGEYMDAHPELFGKPDKANGEDGTWVGELTSGALGKGGTGDDLLSGDEYNKVMFANDLRSGKYEGNYNNVVFKGTNGGGEINTSNMKKEDLEKLAKYMDAANAANPDNPPFPITGGSKNWMEELVTRSEGNNTLDKTEMDSVTKAIESLRGDAHTL